MVLISFSAAKLNKFLIQKKFILIKTQEVKELVDDYNNIYDELVNIYGEEDSEWAEKEATKRFAVKYRKNSNFGIAISVVKGSDLYDVIKNHIKKQTNRLLLARNFLQNI